ncbi:hypothetical protein ACFCYB_23030 [Streptomyces sp. NPDC056309]|uniref:hypothetical protein n=1 Tax=unclassified Streptomyces TaxID=2593676 RepID=UPI0035D59148
MPRTGSDTGVALGDRRRRVGPGPRPGQGSTHERAHAPPDDLEPPRAPVGTGQVAHAHGRTGRRARARPDRPKREWGSSPREGERLRPLTRGQAEDRLQELGGLYAEFSGGGQWAWNEARAAFLRRLAADARRPGFSLLIAETTS